MVMSSMYVISRDESCYIMILLIESLICGLIKLVPIPK
jgi:hypothetical protein